MLTTLQGILMSLSMEKISHSSFFHLQLQPLHQVFSIEIAQAIRDYSSMIFTRLMITIMVVWLVLLILILDGLMSS
jgi:hypothetical protein